MDTRYKARMHTMLLQTDTENKRSICASKDLMLRRLGFALGTSRSNAPSWRKKAHQGPTGDPRQPGHRGAVTRRQAPAGDGTPLRCSLSEWCSRQPDTAGAAADPPSPAATQETQPGGPQLVPVVHRELTSGAGGTLPSAAATVPRPLPRAAAAPGRHSGSGPGHGAGAASLRAAPAGSAGAAFPPQDASGPAATSPSGRGRRTRPRRRAEGAQRSGSEHGPGGTPPPPPPP